MVISMITLIDLTIDALVRTRHLIVLWLDSIAQVRDIFSSSGFSS